ncbi:ATP-binding protein [Thermococci archaeon]|nr:MAG: ATP-binding protein [Thermococci archaeon]
MLRREEIIELISVENFWARPQEVGIERDHYLKHLNRLAKAKDFSISIIGVRRSGKTFLTKQFLKKAIDSGLDPKQTLYVNLEDPRFHPYLSLELLDEIYQAYRTFVNKEGFALIVLDEVQNIKNWEKWVRRTMEKENVQIVMTGSTSSLLKTEVSTALTGRSLTLEVFPLSFHEFLKFKGVVLEDQLDVVKNKAKIERLFIEYLQFGGFPRVVLEEDEFLKREMLKELFDGIVMRDIVFRHGFRDVNSVKLVAELAIKSFSSLKSVSSLRNELAGILKRKVSPNFVAEVMEALRESYLLFTIPPFSPKIKDVKKYPKKIYAVDTGLATTVTLSFSKNLGRLVENAVALHLIKKYGENNLFYYRGKREVDFILREGLKITKAIQVTWDLREGYEREVKALLEAMDVFNLEEGIIVTADQEREEVYEDKEIRILPFWKFLLEFGDTTH